MKMLSTALALIAMVVHFVSLALSVVPLKSFVSYWKTPSMFFSIISPYLSFALRRRLILDWIERSIKVVVGLNAGVGFYPTRLFFAL